MQTISSTLPDNFSLEMNNHTYGLRQVRYPDDLPLLHKWMHTEHVIPQWQLNKPELELHIYFEKMLADDHQRLYIITLDGRDIGYSEIYECYRDRIARYYDALPYDMGFHELLGEPDVLGHGHFLPVLMLQAECILRHVPQTEKVIGEPDVTLSFFRFYAKKLGMAEHKRIDLPEKLASLYFCYRNDFYQSRAYNKLLGEKVAV